MVSLGEATIRVRGDGTLLPGDLREAAKEAGRTAGDQASNHFRREWRRKAPWMLTAGSLGLGAAGAAVVAGGAALFAGLAIAAVASADQVKNAWGDVGDTIVRDAARDAQVMVPTLVGVARDVGRAYQDLRPQLTDGFEAAAPLVERFADAALNAAETAIPSLVRSVDRADPVIDGLNDALDSIAKGFAGMVDNIVDDAPEMGTVVAAIGDAFEAVLPLLGEIIGTSAELGAAVLPALASALKAVASAADLVAPLLVIIGPALLAMKAGKAASGFLTGVATSLGGMAGNMDRANRNMTLTEKTADRTGRAMSRAGDMVGKAGASLPILGVALAVLSSEMEKNERKTHEWTDGLLEGGAAAAKVYEEAAAERAKYERQGFLADASYNADVWLGLAPDIEEAEKAVREYEASLSPLELSQLKADQALAKYNHSVSEFGKHNPRSIAALRDYESATAAAEREQARLEQAVDGTTRAMVSQAEQVLAAANSDVAYRKALDDLGVTSEETRKTIKEFGVTSDEGRIARRELEEDMLAAAEAFAQAQADSLGLEDGLARQGLVAAKSLEELERLRGEYGGNFPPTLNAVIEKLKGVSDGLISTEIQAQLSRAAAETFGLTVTQLPGSKTIFIDAPTFDQRVRLEDLGYAVRTLPNGKFYVTADLYEAETKLQKFMDKRRTMQVKVNLQRGTIPSGLGKNTGVFEAQGGVVEHYANGGYRSMDGGVAQVVAPNTWRVIGDRMVDDEAYIPINKDPRSIAIWEEAGRRMGLLGGGGQQLPNITYAPNITSTQSATAEQIAASAGQHFVRDVRLGISGRFTGTEVLAASR